MPSIRTALVAALLCAPLVAADAQSVLLSAQAVPTLGVTTLRVGSTVTVRTEDGQFRIDADRMEIESDRNDLRPAGTLILEALDAGQDVLLRITPDGAEQPITFVATRFTLTRDATSRELQVRGENLRTP